MSDPAPLTGPDLERGVPSGAIGNGKSLLGHARGEPVLLVRDGGKLHATSATCSHYGGPLAEGLVAGGTVRCPWHHACFDLATGEALGGPALSSLPCYEVREQGGVVKVGEKRPSAARASLVGQAARHVIVGAGPAGTACAEGLRRGGFAGSITLVGSESPGPVDRPNLSKDYLAGTAPEEWIPLRTKEALEEQRIEPVVDDPALEIRLPKREVSLRSGRTLGWDALVLATGAEPAVLPIEGASLPHVHTLRTLADARAIISALPAAKRAVVIGTSFIGLEAAASLKKRGLDVHVVGPDSLPLARVLGADVGRFVKDVHEENGVVFRLGRKPARIDAARVALDDGEELAADLVVMGVGVRPRTKLAEGAGLKVEDGIVVDEGFRTSEAGVYAIGDVARVPYDGQAVRIEHFAVAVRHGQALARALTGQKDGYRQVPFFWSQHHDVTLGYVGHAEPFDSAVVFGDLAKRDAIVAYRRAGRVRAVLTVGRDAASLAAERALETGDDAALAALLRA